MVDNLAALVLLCTFKTLTVVIRGSRNFSTHVIRDLGNFSTHVRSAVGTPLADIQQQANVACPAWCPGVVLVPAWSCRVRVCGELVEQRAILKGCLVRALSFGLCCALSLILIAHCKAVRPLSL